MAAPPHADRHDHARNAHDHGGSGRHDHQAGAGGGHSHAPTEFGARFAIAAALNIALVVAQIVYGILAHSMALLADAGHNAGDVIGLLLAWAALGIGGRPPTGRYTFGFGSASILAALMNGVILLVATGAIAWEAVRRIGEPLAVGGATVMAVAAIGVVVNGVSAWLLAERGGRDLNVRGAILHLVGDAAVSVGVIVAGAAILWTGWNWLDPVASLVVSAAIVWSTAGFLAETMRLSLAAVPDAIDPTAVRTYLGSLPGVSEVHDLHIWAMSTTETALTAHLVRPRAGLDDGLLAGACDELAKRFGIHHVTLQVEAGDRPCRYAPDDVV